MAETCPCHCHCCGQLPVRPILMPWEKAEHYPGVATEQRGLLTYIAQRGDTGHCVYLLKDGRCGIYEARPLECRLYPLLIAWDSETGHPVLELDSRAPCALDSMLLRSVPIQPLACIEALFGLQHADPRWVQAYLEAPG